MTLLSSTFSVICFLFVFQSTDPIQLIPVDGGVVDRGALSSSLQVQQTGYRQDNSFEKLYRIAGSEDVYVRTSGGLHAVFRSSEYMQTKDGEIPLVPAGTVYCIGKLRPEFIAQLGVLQSPRTQETIPEMMVQAELVTVLTSPTPIKKKPMVRSIEFLENESYRRQRLASFVLEIVLSE